MTTINLQKLLYILASANLVYNQKTTHYLTTHTYLQTTTEIHMKLLFTLAVLPLAFVTAMPGFRPIKESAFAHPLGRPAHLSNPNSHAEFNGEEVDFFNHPSFGAHDDSDFYEHSDNNKEHEMDLEGCFEEEYLRQPDHPYHLNGGLAEVFNRKMRHHDNSDNFRPEFDNHHNLEGEFEGEEDEAAHFVKPNYANDGGRACSHDLERHGSRMQHDRPEGHFRHGRN